MTWVRLDDQFPFNPKVTAAGDEAAFMYVCSLCYSAAHLTDGFVPEGEVARLTHHKKPQVPAGRLVASGLWVKAPGGYRIHDFDKMNPPAAKVKEKREKDRERKNSTGNPDGIQTEKQPASGGNPNGVHASSSSSQSSDVVKSSSSSSPVGAPGSEEEDWPIAIARRRLAGRQGPPVIDQGAWLRKAAAAALGQHRAAAGRFTADHPGASQDQLCDFLEHGKRLAVVRPPCPDGCASGWVIDAAGSAAPCPACNARPARPSIIDITDNGGTEPRGA